MSDLGIVAIGRNEGERLRRCLESLVGRGLPIVYVNGNSTDGSVELAQSMGVEVVREDPTRSNCAATARNEGFERLLQVAPDVRFVHVRRRRLRGGQRLAGPGPPVTSRRTPASRWSPAVAASGTPSGRSTTAWRTSSGTCRSARSSCRTAT